MTDSSYRSVVCSGPTKDMEAEDWLLESSSITISLLHVGVVHYDKSSPQSVLFSFLQCQRQSFLGSSTVDKHGKEYARFRLDSIVSIVSIAPIERQ